MRPGAGPGDVAARPDLRAGPGQEGRPAGEAGRLEGGQARARPRRRPRRPPSRAKDEAKKEEPPKATEAPLPPIPKEVQDKIDAARRAVAEAIVAAQDAGLVETSIDPPPILDILVTGRATDARTLKNATAKKPYGVSPEVFAAWFTGYGTQAFESVDYVKDLRIVNPSGGPQGAVRPAGGHPPQRDRRGPQGQGTAGGRQARREGRGEARREAKKKRRQAGGEARREAGRHQEGRRAEEVTSLRRRRRRAPRLRSGDAHVSVGMAGRRCLVTGVGHARPVAVADERQGLPPDSRFDALARSVSPLERIATRPIDPVTPSVVSKATAPLFLSLACEAARRSGASGMLILPEGPMDWDSSACPPATARSRSWWPAPRRDSSRRSARRA